MPRKSETKHALSGTEDGCRGGRGWEGKREGKEGRGARREAHGWGRSETGCEWVGAGREDGGERDGRRMGREVYGDGAGEGRWRGARREAHGWGRGLGGSKTGGAWLGLGRGLGREDGGERSETAGGMGREDGGERDGRCMGTGLGREDGGERDGRRMDGDGAGEGAKRNEAWRGPMLLHASRLQNVVVRVERSCAVDLLVTRTWVHHKHQCRLLRVSSQVERSMGWG